jgi:DNA-binding XRE family transcriptional regulator
MKIKEYLTQSGNINLEDWSNEMGIDIHEIDQKLKIRDIIVKVRKKQEITQEELAEKVGVSRSRVAQIENGIKLHKMSFDILLRVLQGLGYKYNITARRDAA